MADQEAAALPGAATGAAARALAARLAEHGYRVRFPPGRDPAVFRVTGLPGDPCVEVTAEDDGPASCHYTGRSTAEAAKVIARLPAAGHSHGSTLAGDTVTAVWGGTDVEWHYMPPAGQAAGPGQVITALLAHLAVLDGRHDGASAMPCLPRTDSPGTAPGGVTTCNSARTE